MKKVIRIGGASGYWGESAMATPQLLASGDLDYLVFDYLAEITMSIMARARAKDPAQGYASDFIRVVLKDNLHDIARQGVRVISNAGGVNPEACAAAARALIRETGLDLKVAVVTGDDLTSHAAGFAEAGVAEMFSGEHFPDAKRVASINAYLGAFPIAEALGRGADIVITGRCVDSAVTLGACIHEFGWQADDWDRLAAGTLAGHLIECGPQVTGGNFTDWEQVAATIQDIGYPIAEIDSVGVTTVTKPEGTGGLVSPGTVAEQMLYEIGDPQAYIVPDVVCDFSGVRFTQVAPDRVRVEGAKGTPATDNYKACATVADGFRGGTVMTFYGIDADAKARAFAEAAVARARKTLRTLNIGDFREISIEVIGAESQYGAGRRIDGAREVAVKIAAKHDEQKGVGVLLREISGLGLATPPGLSGFQGGRPSPSPVVRLFSFLVPKAAVPITLNTDGDTVGLPIPKSMPARTSAIARPENPDRPDFGGTPITVPLIRLAWGRSGDKGDHANVGIIARNPDYLPFIWAALTEEVVAGVFAHFDPARVERFYLPGPPAINFMIHEVLGGGGMASLRNDPQGKGYAQILLDYPIPVPARLAGQV
ncbi:MAG: acyclic terpene utilization AtuA family protein [Alphaproteobacteria bacterium]